MYSFHTDFSVIVFLT